MKTRGTADLDLLTDDELRHLIASCALDVYEGHTLGAEEFEFARGTLEKFLAERRRRDALERVREVARQRDASHGVDRTGG